MYSLLLCVLLSRLSENKAKLTDVPKNIAVLEGETVTMRCSIDQSGYSPRWFRENFNRENKVFTGSQMNKLLFPDYDINRTLLGQYDLMIDSVNTSHAGKYICQEVSPSQIYESWSSSELVVVIVPELKCDFNRTAGDSTASTSVTPDEDFFTAWCTVSFQGNLFPVMEWNTGNIKESISVGTVGNRSEPIITLTSTLILPIASNFIPDITCTLKFTDSTPFSSNASNVPEYNRVWNLLPSHSTTPFITPGADQIKSTESGKPENSMAKPLIIVTTSITVLSMLVIAIALILWKVKTQGNCYMSQKQLPDPDVITVDSTPTNQSNRDTDDQSDISDFDAVYYNDQIGNLVALKLPPNKIGEDGTEYVQMNYEAANSPQIAAKPKLAKPVPSSAADVYAAIDHTMVLPSRGNKKRRK